MDYYGRRNPSIFDSFTLSPLPYPVLFILLVVLLLLGPSWFFTYEEFIENTEALSWMLLASPLVLLIIIWFLGFYSYDQSWRRYIGWRQEGSSPWGVAAIVILLLVLISFQPYFQDMWRA